MDEFPWSGLTWGPWAIFTGVIVNDPFTATFEQFIDIQGQAQLIKGTICRDSLGRQYRDYWRADVHPYVRMLVIIFDAAARAVNAIDPGSGAIVGMPAPGLSRPGWVITEGEWGSGESTLEKVIAGQVCTPMAVRPRGGGEGRHELWVSERLGISVLHRIEVPGTSKLWRVIEVQDGEPAPRLFNPKEHGSFEIV